MAEKKTALTRGVKGSAETNAKLADLERRMLAVKRAFEMYFNGLEKRPPLVEFQQLTREFRGLSGSGYATATLRFKVQNTISRFNQYKTLWERQMRKFEEGSYKPGVGAAPGRGPRGKTRR